jgi:hypothetical protein
VTLFSLLLRVVLCVSLIANGAGYAQASARMQFDHAAHAAPVVAAQAQTVASADEADVPPCHRNVAKTTPVASMHAGHEMAQADVSPAGKATPATPAGKKPGPDCCKGKTCNCACAHAYCATVVAFATSIVPEHDARVPALAVDHPQPRLAHLIRPPIG